MRRPTGRPAAGEAADRAARPPAHLHRRRAGVGKTYSMIEDAHAFRRDGVDVVVGFVETHGRAETEATAAATSRSCRDARSTTAASCSKRWTSTPSSRASRSSASSTSWRTPTRRAAATRSAIRTCSRSLDAGIGVMTAVNIQHLETLNDAVGRVTGVRVRETVPGHVPRSRRRGRQRRRHRRGAPDAAAAGQGLQAGEGRAGARRTSSARPTCRRCASWRCARSPTKWATRPRRAGSAKASSRR